MDVETIPLAPLNLTLLTLYHILIISFVKWADFQLRDPPTWKAEYMMTVRGRFPENSAILNISRPQRLMSSTSWRRKTAHLWDTVCLCVCVTVCVRAPVCGPTLASRLSCGVLTPKRGMQAGAKLGLCVAFFTPLICDIGLFFFSFSLRVGDRISTSCCFSATCTNRHRRILLNKYVRHSDFTW